ncbi:uncharacterized protein EURHEDRAFT_380343 [Aspergillus ruber CBS 135680]|uniref:Diphthamide biosynthesis protein 4 n=1 Tax=Aspergillus ruber (strain CBS 135680) TaxID=1388766 RepID=A0A017S6K0_ASPRC|nr:uncharacterized protein EURHEDRAFT_380343 [Aspergillus ruber CBS 135680]EYE92254.1 hypothetical protein EURHEDRAFT_380343 [Aspergillus ruber CBS 135680]
MAGENAVHDHDYYTILNIPFTSSATLTTQQLKLAYHRALLRHHPDKTNTKEADLASTPDHHDEPTTNTYTIDQITTAYKTLSSPTLRTEYDRALRLDRAKTVDREKNGTVFHTGLEVVDLEDLVEDDNDNNGEGVWYRGCRCGDERGFMITEGDLEREIEGGEVVVGCRGCSLYMKVLFAVEG